jgi:hypothetical protein
MKITNTYDANGNMTKATTQKWNTVTSVWEVYMMTSYTLNTDGTAKESLTQMNNQDGMGWIDMSKSTFTYNASKQVLTEAAYSWGGIMWFASTTRTNTYESGGHLLNVTMQSSDFLTQQMKNFWKIDYTYNSDGSSNQTINQSWNATNQWVNSSRTTSSYISSNQKASVLNENWVNGAWVNSTRWSYTSSNNGLALEMLREDWTNGNWTDGSKFLNTMNSNHQPIQFTWLSWNTDLKIWENVSRDTWDYNFTGIQLAELAGKALKVFPNPFVDELTIENGTLDIAGIQVFNITGQLVNSFKSNGSVTKLNLGSLKTGTYFMKIKSPQNEQTIKLLKVE